MSDLPSMLVPLAGGHFPGWPTTEAPSVVQNLLLLVGIPVAIAVVVGILTLSATLTRRGRGGNVQVAEPLWLGQIAGSREFATGSAHGELTRGGHPIETTTGGASVRW
ncbi:hypothetical protein [Granulicoccus sp. GXG6511]|uniref:hypothetical protein n=1 Tax=Granulicoccus sp. GXG6511 TaxID=3381351 RepID=UPI003D7C7172